MKLMMIPEGVTSKGRHQLKKKTFSFGHCPNYLTPPPHDPDSGNLVLFFLEVEIQDLKVSLELRILYVLYILYRVVFLTGPPDFQYQNEKTCSANEELFYIENFVKN